MLYVYDFYIILLMCIGVLWWYNQFSFLEFDVTIPIVSIVMLYVYDFYIILLMCIGILFMPFSSVLCLALVSGF